MNTDSKNMQQMTITGSTTYGLDAEARRYFPLFTGIVSFVFAGILPAFAVSLPSIISVRISSLILSLIISVGIISDLLRIRN